MESFKLTPEKSQTVSLGCGTLILIAIIVLIFSKEGTKDFEREIDGLRKEVKSATAAIEAQSRQLQSIQDSIAKSIRPQKETEKANKDK